MASNRQRHVGGPATVALCLAGACLVVLASSAAGPATSRRLREFAFRPLAQPATLESDPSPGGPTATASPSSPVPSAVPSPVPTMLVASLKGRTGLSVLQLSVANSGGELAQVHIDGVWLNTGSSAQVVALSPATGSGALSPTADSGTQSASGPCMPSDTSAFPIPPGQIAAESVTVKVSDPKADSGYLGLLDCASQSTTTLPVSIERSPSAGSLSLWLVAAFLVTLVFLLVIASTRLPWEPHFWREPLAEAVDWKASDSWASNLTALASAVFAFANTSGVLDKVAPSVSTTSALTISLVAAALVAAAPLIFAAVAVSDNNPATKAWGPEAKRKALDHLSTAQFLQAINSAASSASKQASDLLAGPVTPEGITTLRGHCSVISAMTTELAKTVEHARVPPILKANANTMEDLAGTVQARLPPEVPAADLSIDEATLAELTALTSQLASVATGAVPATQQTGTVGCRAGFMASSFFVVYAGLVQLIALGTLISLSDLNRWLYLPLVLTLMLLGKYAWSTISSGLQHGRSYQGRGRAAVRLAATGLTQARTSKAGIRAAQP